MTNPDTGAAGWVDRKLTVVLPVAVICLVGCSKAEVRDWVDVGSIVAGVTSAPEPDAPIPLKGSRTADTMDLATDAERAKATAPATAGARLGTTTASLGTPSEAGYWLKTPLVQSELSGVLSSPDTGKSVSVKLKPIDGPPTAGSRISLSALRALGLPLTALARIDVARAG